MPWGNRQAFLYSREAWSRVILLRRLLSQRGNKNSTSRTLCTLSHRVRCDVPNDLLGQKIIGAPDETFHVWGVARMHNFYSVHFLGRQSIQSQNKTRRTFQHYHFLWSKPTELIQSCSSNASKRTVSLDFHLGAHNRHKHLPLCRSFDARTLPL